MVCVDLLERRKSSLCGKLAICRSKKERQKQEYWIIHKKGGIKYRPALSSCACVLNFCAFGGCLYLFYCFSSTNNQPYPPACSEWYMYIFCYRTPRNMRTARSLVINKKVVLFFFRQRLVRWYPVCFSRLVTWQSPFKSSTRRELHKSIRSADFSWPFVRFS